MERFGKFKIVQELGRGGMGAVYRAQDTELGREVALKVILEDVLDIPEIKDRFRREAQSLAQIDHENVTILYEFGYEHGQPFMAMQFLQGEDLDKVLEEIASGEREPLSLLQKLDIALQICRGLQIAHTRNIVHRDIKPANIKILPDDKVKIMDFGIAKPAKGTLITVSGQQIGTPNYMSPEQVRGIKEIDKRSDIFSFGVLFYELLSNQRPFTGADLYELMQSIVHNKPEKIDLPDTQHAEDLGKIVSKCLEKKVEDRYSDFSQVMAELAPIYNRVQVRSLPASGTEYNATGKTKALDGDKTLDISHPGIFDKGRQRTAVMGIVLLASLFVLFFIVRFVAQGSDTSLSPQEMASKARDALADLKSNASELGPEFLESAGYLAALQLEQQGSEAMQSKLYDQAGVSFEAAVDSLAQALRRYEMTRDQLKGTADAARNRMLVEKGLADREGANELSKTLYQNALKLEARADSNYQVKDLSSLQNATALFDLARNKFIEARDQTDIRKREQSDTKSVLTRLLSRVQDARDSMLAVKLQVPGSPSDKAEDKNFQTALQAERQAQELRNKNEHESALQKFERATQAYRAAVQSVKSVLQSRAERAQSAVRTAKSKIKPDFQNKTAYQDALRAEQEGVQAYDRGDFSKATGLFDSATTLLNSLALEIAQQEADEIQARLALDAAITRVRKEYSKSLETGDIETLQSLYKNFRTEEKEKWLRVFEFTEDREVTIAEDSKIVRDNSAILDLLIKIKYKDNKNRQQELNYAYIWTLEQIDGKWLISEFEEKS